MKICKILIVDDHPVVLKGLQQIFVKHKDLRLLAEINDGTEVFAKIAEVNPDIVLLDIYMPALDGFSIATQLQIENPKIKIIFLTVYREESYLERALKLGAKGYILKDSDPLEIVTGVKAVCNGQSFISPAMTATLIGRAKNWGQPVGIEVLTATERAILKLLAQYKTTKEIAAAIFVSPRTIEAHRNNMCHKLHLRGSHALMKYAVAHFDEL